MTFHHIVKLFINLFVLLFCTGGEDIRGIIVWAVAASVLLLIQGLHDIRIGSALVGFVVLCVLQQDFVHVSAGVLKQLVGAVEDDEGYFTVTENTQLVGLLHQTKLSLHESHLSVPFIHDPSDLNLLPPHG